MMAKVPGFLSKIYLLPIWLLAGLLLMAAGFRELYLGAVVYVAHGNAPVTETSPEATEPKREEANTPGPSLFRYRFEDRWYVETRDGRERKALPDFKVPDARFNPPGRPLQASELSRVLSETLAINSIVLEGETARQLADFTIAGVRPYADLIGGATERPPTLTSTGQGTRDQATANYPEAIHPQTDLFRRQMLAWKQQVASQLGKPPPPRGPYRISFTHPTEGRSIAIKVYGNARNRIMAEDFGAQPRDRFIYLQVVANLYGHDVSVDGRYGSSSERALTAVLGETFNQPNLVQTYIADIKALVR